MTARLGIVGVPDDLEATCARCAQLGVDPVLLLARGAVQPDESHVRVVEIDSWGDGAAEFVLRDADLSGLWSASGQTGPHLAQHCAVLALPTLPCLSETDQAALPIAGATVYSSSALPPLDDLSWQRLTIPAWVRAACTGGDSSCMRLEHRNDLSLASAKLRKRNSGGLIRIQPVVDGPVYRILAFKTGASIAVAEVIAEDVTTSVYRVPLGKSMPLDRAVRSAAVELAERVNGYLPEGWGYVEIECVGAPEGLELVDVQSPALLEPQLCNLVALSSGMDLRLASMACALGRVPELSPRFAAGVAMTWLLTRSGVVTGFRGIAEARALPGIVEVCITAAEGDILSHVVDIPSRERGGYVVSTGASAAEARERLEAARAMIWIYTSPALG